MATRSTKKSWLEGPGDLKEAEVENVPVKGESVLVRGLPAQFSNQASSEALKMVTGPGGEQSATVDTARMAVIQFANGVIDPKFTAEEAQLVAEKYGPAFNRVVAKIDELSGVDKDAIDEANARFQGGVEEPGHVREEGDARLAPNGVGPAVPSGAGA